MAFWSGKGKTLARINVMQVRCFNSLKKYWQFKKYAHQMLTHKKRQMRESKLRKVFQGWLKDFKTRKIQRDQAKFDTAVKRELQLMSATYQKEIESMRQKLAENERKMTMMNRHKHMMQENLKKVFMRSVCALNFEAMNILDPND